MPSRRPTSPEHRVDCPSRPARRRPRGSARLSIRWIEAGELLHHRLNSSERPTALAVHRLALDARDADRDERHGGLRAPCESARLALGRTCRRSSASDLRCASSASPGEHGIRSGKNHLTCRVDSNGNVATIEDLRERAEGRGVILHKPGWRSRRLVIAHPPIVTRTQLAMQGIFDVRSRPDRG